MDKYGQCVFRREEEENRLSKVVEGSESSLSMLPFRCLIRLRCSGEGGLEKWR